MLRIGNIPEFVQVSDIIDIYKYITVANLKNTYLVKQKHPEFSDDAVELQNIKEDVVMIQFKLVHRETLSTANTFTFVNVPATGDVNTQTLAEILSKLNLAQKKRASDYLPYNKSVMTRILFQMLKRNNVLVLSHYTKKTLNRYMEIPASV